MWVVDSRVGKCGWEVGGWGNVVGGRRVGKCGWEAAEWEGVAGR